MAILHVSHRQAIGSPWVYPWIYPWIFPWISTKKSVDMDVDIDGKFHIHGKHVSLSSLHQGDLGGAVQHEENFVLGYVALENVQLSAFKV